MYRDKPDLMDSLNDRILPRFKDLPMYKQEQELKILCVLLGFTGTINKHSNESDDDYIARCFVELYAQLPDESNYAHGFHDTYMGLPEESRNFNLPHVRVRRLTIRIRTFDLHINRPSKFVSSSPNNRLWKAPDKNHFFARFKGLEIDKQEEEIRNLSRTVGGVRTTRLQNETDEDYRIRSFGDMLDQLSPESLYLEAFRDTYEPEGSRFLRMKTSDVNC